jgi:hypothetical protein
MSYFAYVQDGRVQEVIKADQQFVDSLPPRAGEWIQTSYNTRGGQHLLNGTPLRKNYAGPGMIYDAERDAFYDPQPFASWTLNEDTCQWQAPVAVPLDGYLYTWNEQAQNWQRIEGIVA